MSQRPDEIRADIERTRSELAGNVDALENKVSPSAVAHRTVDSAKGAAVGVKDRIIGTSHDVVSGAGSAVSSTKGDATTAVRDRTTGSPLVAGAVAFGAGFLLSGLLPAGRREAQAGAALLDKASELKEPAKQHLSEMASEAKQQVTPAVEEAVGSVKASATDAAAAVKETAASAGSQLGDTAKEAGQAVREQTTASAGGLTEPGSSTPAAGPTPTTPPMTAPSTTTPSRTPPPASGPSVPGTTPL